MKTAKILTPIKFSMFALSLLLASCAFSQAQAQPQTLVHNGYWWTDSTPEFKLGFVSGYALSMTKVSDISGFECLTAKGGGAQTPPKVLREMLTDCMNSFDVARWDFQKITMGQLQEGLDAFYGDFRNKAVDVNDAISYVRDQLKGKSPAELEQRLENIRAAARR